MTLVDLFLVATAIPPAVASAYLGLLTALSGRAALLPAVPPRVRFVVVVPAHDEERSIAATVESLFAMDRPKELFRVVVVADNCSDSTEAIALESGAEVLVRDDRTKIGKGFALAYAFEAVLAEGSADAVVVVDADTLVSPNLLTAFEARLAEGATAVQADYRVRNPEASWRTTLAAIAFATFHELRSRARERLGVSAGLRGNGMCFTTALLRAVRYDAFSVVEDLEAGIRFAEAGHRVRYANDAHVRGEMVSTERASRSQRVRWEGGRRRMAREHAAGLLRRAIAERDPVALDLAVDLLVPPLATLATVVVAGVAAAGLVSWMDGHVSPAIWLWIASLVLLSAYVARGWMLSETGLRGLAALAHVPGYVFWKLTLPLRRSRGADEWIRTTREGQGR